MNEFNRTLVEFVISIIAPLVVAYVTNRRTEEESVFFSYITLKDEGFVKKTKRRSNLLMFIFVFLHLTFLFNGYMYTLPINISITEKIERIGSIALLLLAIGQFLSNCIIVFSDIKYLDKKIQKRNTGYSEIENGINNVIIIIYIVGFLIMILCKIKQDYLLLEAIILLYVTIGIEAVYSSFISLYVKIRRRYHVDEINIRTKTNKKVYKSVFNYKKKVDTYEFVYEDDKILKRISVPSDDIESIEKVIDSKVTFLDTIRK